MLSHHIHLPNSNISRLALKTCSRCGHDKTSADGVEMGPKFYCGSCWRNTAPRGAAGLRHLKASRSKK